MVNNHHTLIIAEVGVNHNGDIKIAKRLIEAARYQSSIDEEAQPTDEAQQAEIGLSPAANSIIQSLTPDAAAQLQEAAQ